MNSSGGRHAVDAGLLLTAVHVVESELVAAVMAHRHSQVAEVDDLDIMRVTRIGRVRVVAPVHGSQCRPDDRVGAVRCHESPIGTPAAKP